MYDELLEEGERDLPQLLKGQRLKLSSHGNRGGGTRLAMDLRSKTGVSKDDIDLAFRWRVEELDEDMQHLYAGLPGSRARLAVNEWF